jgi:hypothetical protein
MRSVPQPFAPLKRNDMPQAPWRVLARLRVMLSVLCTYTAGETDELRAARRSPGLLERNRWVFREELAAWWESRRRTLPAQPPDRAHTGEKPGVTAPTATPDQIILVLGDFRGDVWLMDL